MRPDLMTALVDDVMTKNPKTIRRDLLASEALEILNSSKITALIVTEASKPVGIVHLHDLLRAGVVLARVTTSARSATPETAPPFPPAAGRSPFARYDTVR